MVAAGEDDVLHACVAGGFCPGVGIKLFGMELGGEFGVLVDGDLLIPLDPLASAGDGVESPVDEEAELGVSPPLDAGVCAGVFDHGRPLAMCGGECAEDENEDCEESSQMPSRLGTVAHRSPRNLQLAITSLSLAFCVGPPALNTRRERLWRSDVVQSRPDGGGFSIRWRMFPVQMTVHFGSDDDMREGLGRGVRRDATLFRTPRAAMGHLAKGQGVGFALYANFVIRRLCDG